MSGGRTGQTLKCDIRLTQIYPARLQSRSRRNTLAIPRKQQIFFADTPIYHKQECLHIVKDLTASKKGFITLRGCIQTIVISWQLVIKRKYPVYLARILGR